MFSRFFRGLPEPTNLLGTGFFLTANLTSTRVRLTMTMAVAMTVAVAMAVASPTRRRRLLWNSDAPSGPPKRPQRLLLRHEGLKLIEGDDAIAVRVELLHQRRRRIIGSRCSG